MVSPVFLGQVQMGGEKSAAILCLLLFLFLGSKIIQGFNFRFLPSGKPMVVNIQGELDGVVPSCFDTFVVLSPLERLSVA